MRPLPLLGRAINRLTAEGCVLGPEPRISPAQTQRAYSIDAAWPVLREDHLGSTGLVKSVNFAVLSKNPLEHAKAIKDIEVLATVKDGEVVYRGIKATDTTLDLSCRDNEID